MDSCWAASLGDCDKKLSREHLVSQSLFVGERITAQGFSWCKDEPKEIGLSSLTAKILCSRHNSVLSPIDTAGAKAFATFREMRRLGNVRKQLKPPLSPVRYRIDGRRLERWFLKTLVNLASNGDHPIGRNSDVAGRPTEELVQIAFGRKSFEKRAGLYSIVHVGMNLTSEDRVTFGPLIKDGKHIEGGLFAFRGFLFLLFLESDGPPSFLTGISFAGQDLSRSQLNFHNEKVVEMVGKSRSQILIVDW